MEPGPEPAGAGTVRASSPKRIETGGNTRLAPGLFLFGLLVYAVTRFVRLSDFPIFFFTDEAIQANTAQSLFTHHFRDGYGVFLPPYFLNDARWAMSLNIYLLVLPIVVLGKTVLVTRGTFVVVSLLGAAAAGGALKVMKSPAWWSPPFLLAAMPVDFLHSRIAFETTPACMAGFLCAYLLYRLRSPRYLFLAILFGAATFYSYTAGQGIMLVFGILLFVTDFRYHLRVFRENPWILAGSLLLLALVAVPLVREQLRHPHTTRDQLQILNSYWVGPAPLTRKLHIFVSNYVRAFSPVSWFRPGIEEALRHRLKGIAYVPAAYAPLLLLGIGGAFLKWHRSPGHRVILLSPIAVPFAAAAAERQILRVLPMIVPIALLAALGLAELFPLVRRPVLLSVVSALSAAALAVSAGQLTRVAIRDGPTWFRSYGLYGLQYGARQVFQIIREELARSPSTRVVLSSVWANNPEPFIEFFLTPPERKRARIADVDGYLLYRMPLSPEELFILTPEQYHRAVSSGKLIVSRPERTVPWPDNRTGFYFVRLEYSPAADAILQAEREARRRLVEETASISGESVVVRHSLLDIGLLRFIFDGRPDTLIRGFEANPFVLEISFASPRRIARVHLILGTMKLVRLCLQVTPADGAAPASFEKTYTNLRGEPLLDIVLPGGPVRTSQIRIEIEDITAGETSHIHVRELSFE